MKYPESRVYDKEMTKQLMRYLKEKIEDSGFVDMLFLRGKVSDSENLVMKKASLATHPTRPGWLRGVGFSLEIHFEDIQPLIDEDEEPVYG